MALLNLRCTSGKMCLLVEFRSSYYEEKRQQDQFHKCIKQIKRMNKFLKRVAQMQKNQKQLLAKQQPSQHLHILKQQVLKHLITDQKLPTQHQQPLRNFETQSPTPIPPNLSIQLLEGNKSKTLLFGIQKQNLDHTKYLLYILSNRKYQAIMTQIRSDNMHFLYKGSINQWVKEGYLGRFLINPLPKYLEDIIFNLQKSKILIKNFQRNKDITITTTINLPETNNFYLPILHQYQKSLNFPIIIGGCPTLSLVPRLAYSGLQNLKDMFFNYVQNKGKIYDYQSQYMVEVLYRMNQMTKRNIAIVDVNDAQDIFQKWKNHKRQQFQPKKWSQSQPPMFLQYMQSLVIADILTGQQITNNYLMNGCFPLSTQGSIQNQKYQVNNFMVWDYYYKRYKKYQKDRMKEQRRLQDMSNVQEQVRDEQRKTFQYHKY